MRLDVCLAHLLALEAALATELRAAAERHRDERDVYHQCRAFARGADARATQLAPFVPHPVAQGRSSASSVAAGGSADVLEELRALGIRLHEVALTWAMALQAAKALRDPELIMGASECLAESTVDAQWFLTRIKTAAPQALTVG